MWARRNRTPLFAAPILVLAFALAGCGEPAAGGGTGSASTGTSQSDAAGGGTGGKEAAGTGSERYEQALKFVECMREHGVEMDDPDPGGAIKFQIKGKKQDLEKAQEACREYRPSGGSGNGPGGGTPQKMLNFAQCMRDNGVEEFPDPTGGRMRMSKKLAEDPDFETAQQKCSEQFLPEIGN